MHIDQNKSSRILVVIEFTIGICYLFLGLDHPTYIIIGAAHLVSVLLHGRQG